MLNKNKLLCFALSVLPAFACNLANAQAYPAKPVRVIVPFPAGGGLDMIVRPVMQKVSESTKQSFVMDYRGGANGIVGMEAGAKSAPDGYTLITTTTGSHTINPNVHAKLPFDVTRDLLPITNFAEAPFVLVCHPSLAARNPRELVALAKSRPGELNYGSPGVGGINHLGMELFGQLAGGLRLTHITFKGSAPLLIDVMGGHVMLAFDSIQATGPHIKNKRLRALGLAADTRTPVAPDIPTITEAGGPAGYELISWYGLSAPNGTPTDGSRQQRIARTPDRHRRDAPGDHAGGIWRSDQGGFGQVGEGGAGGRGEGGVSVECTTQ
jgi:tripartite-type tricarboxylate transporter receptor subunit TctC